jgi:hypothetical protein
MILAGRGEGMKRCLRHREFIHQKFFRIDEVVIEISVTSMAKLKKEKSPSIDALNLRYT